MSRATPTLDRRQLLKIFGAIAAAGATSGLAACTASSAQAGPRGRITVGLVAPTSGPYARIGEDLRRGFQLFLDTNDGLLGNLTVDLMVTEAALTDGWPHLADSWSGQWALADIRKLHDPDAGRYPGCSLCTRRAARRTT